MHDYQERGLGLLTASPGGCGLCIDPGMGKTRIAQESIVRLREQYPGLQALVIAPKQTLYGTWRQEAEKWGLDLTFSIVHGTPKQREKALQVEADIYLINPEGIQWLFRKDTIKNVGHPDWRVLCVDESTKFKKTDTQRFKAIKKHFDHFFWRWIMTGTIAPNGLEDLFGQIYVLDQGESLGKYITHYRKLYFDDIGPPKFPKWVPRVGSLEAVIDKLEPKILQLRAEDYLQMPDMITVERSIELPPDARAMYDQLEQDFIIEIANGAPIMGASAGAIGTKLRQVANGAVYDIDGTPQYIHDAKLEALDDICEETAGAPLMIMYEFRHDLWRIKRKLGKEAVVMTGKAGPELTQILDDFNRGRIKYLLMHPQSTHGLNIQKSCHHIVWFSIIWNLEYYIQANTRLYRQGQTSPSVMCYHLVAAGTTDKSVAQALAAKDVTQKQIETALRGKSDVEKFIQA